jgi:two-component system sensor histidine kinase HupT/HoxJ
VGDIRIHKAYDSQRLVLASGGELNQVLMNLIDNALRFTAGNIWIRYSDRDDRVVLGVEDDGPGVPAELVGRLFDPFFTTSEPGEGTGLGLYLSRRIVAQHGGKLRYHRREGGGASFTVELPAEGT